MSPIPLRTSHLELVINQSGDSDLAERAACELGQMRDALTHLSNHLVAVKRQTDHSVACLQSLIQEFEADSPAQLARRLA